MTEATLIVMNILVQACRDQLRRLHRSMDEHAAWLKSFTEGKP
ncbi:MAG TPA: hypothetical protein VEK57_07135 [Thermoanaerobaculia bacterium]|nr:hypothetical protein [Thermoanaerobaculia bacterium]